MVLEKTLERPLDCKEIQPVHSKGDQPWDFFGRKSDFIFGGSKITADGDCSREIKRRLLFGRKVMINLYSILKSRDITLPTKVRLVKALPCTGHMTDHALIT